MRSSYRVLTGPSWQPSCSVVSNDGAEANLDEAVWAKELERRAAAVADGTADLVPWDDFRAALHADLKARREAAGR